MLDYIKTYIGIPKAITVYDDKLEMLRKQALIHLKKNGIKAEENEESELVKEFVASFCRLYNISEPNTQWAENEKKRLQSLQELMYYGGV